MKLVVISSSEFKNIILNPKPDRSPYLTINAKRLDQGLYSWILDVELLQLTLCHMAILLVTS